MVEQRDSVNEKNDMASEARLRRVRVVCYGGDIIMVVT